MSSGLGARDARALWHPYTQHGLETAPLPVVSASGAVLTLEDGRTLIDAVSSWWTCLHGHGHAALVEAMRLQAQRLDHVLFAGTTHEPAVRLAEDLLAAWNGPLDRPLSRVFFSDDGSTAVETALKMTRQMWVHRGEVSRALFVALEGGYHGDTIGAMSIGDPEPFGGPWAPMRFPALLVPPDAGRLESVLHEHRSRVAGLVLEPLVQGAAGMRMYAPGFLKDARTLCDRFGIPLIADEVFTGFGRTGALFASHAAGVAPDLVCLAKGLTGGMLPLAATLASEEIYEAFLSRDRSRAFLHGHSMTANPIACAVASTSLALCRTEETPARLARLGDRIVAALAPCRGLAGVADVRALGGVVAVELRPEESGGGGYFAGRALRLRELAARLGVLLRPLGDVLYTVPPSCTTPEQAGRIAEAIAACAGAPRC